MKYDEVVALAKKSVKARTQSECRNHYIELSSCALWEKGDQINLWTYWQGYQLKDIDEKGVDILLVGQDWGNPDNNPVVCKNIERIQAGDKDAFYLSNTSATDRNLIELFKIIGCDITKKDHGKRIFFTNYSLGYRKGSETGGMTKGLMKKDIELFKELVLSIKPKIIICLGKLTFEMVTNKVAKGFLEKLKKGEPFMAQYPSEEGIMVYGVAHCGARGISNVGGIEIMRNTWERIDI